MSDLIKQVEEWKKSESEFKQQCLHRLSVIERRISGGDVSHQEFDEVGLTERIDLLRDEIRELEGKIADVENNDNFY